MGELCSRLPVLPAWLPAFLTATSSHDAYTINGWCLELPSWQAAQAPLSISTETGDVLTNAEEWCWQQWLL